jgi:hypothetical protein
VLSRGDARLEVGFVPHLSIEENESQDSSIGLYHASSSSSVETSALHSLSW